MDDSQDREWYRPPYSYQPILGDATRGGLGLRMEVRAFQWSHVLAEDIIFFIMISSIFPILTMIVHYLDSIVIQVLVVLVMGRTMQTLTNC